MQKSKVFIALIIVMLTGCSELSLKQQAAEELIFYTTGITLGHNQAQCDAIHGRCNRDGYSEWTTEDGVINCSCKKN
ncbi:hypothetical protein PY479_09100 [Shewanella sp. A32]|uniref:lipoprotein n=1 Tax=Shewanella sp. A32 TaxID=3031327 RepID=UPI0023B9BD4E|nr:hypothetical protein [Shewanella sp. A32]MDF0534430.1 hypothetical protein [Shewanella sp. A32]